MIDKIYISNDLEALGMLETLLINLRALCNVIDQVKESQTVHADTATAISRVLQGQLDITKRLTDKFSKE